MSELKRPGGLSPLDMDEWSRDLEVIESQEWGIDPHSQSVKARLLRRTMEGVITVQIPSNTPDEPPIAISIRKRMPETLFNRFITVVNHLRMVKAGAEEPLDDYESVRKFISKVLAFVSKDPELDYNYWNSGVGYTADVPLAIIEALSQEAMRALEDARQFRPNGGGASSI